MKLEQLVETKKDSEGFAPGKGVKDAKGIKMFIKRIKQAFNKHLDVEVEKMRGGEDSGRPYFILRATAP